MSIYTFVPLNDKLCPCSNSQGQIPGCGKFWLTVSMFENFVSIRIPCKITGKCLTIIKSRSVHCCSFFNLACFWHEILLGLRKHGNGENESVNRANINQNNHSPANVSWNIPVPSRSILPIRIEDEQPMQWIPKSLPYGLPSLGSGVTQPLILPFLSRSLSKRQPVVCFFFFSFHSKWVSACEALNNPALQGMFCRNCMTRLPKGLPLDFLCPWVYFI